MQYGVSPVRLASGDDIFGEVVEMVLKRLRRLGVVGDDVLGRVAERASRNGAS